jgi:hypothetical protein
MVTLWHPTYVTFHNGTSLLHAGNPHVFFDPIPFMASGPARGNNRPIPGQEGVQKRQHVRGELTVESECRIDGRRDDNGAPIAPGSRDVLGDWIEVRDFFEAAEGRQLSLTFHHGDLSAEADITYKTHGQLGFTGDVLEVSFLFTVPEGIVDDLGESS